MMYRGLFGVCLTLAFSATAFLPLPAVGWRQPIWRTQDLRPGMKGHGLSVFVGTELQRFEVEVLGVLRDTSPGRDLVLARLSGCNLENTGVIAGMSGSPVYIDGKLVGAVAYAWAFGKEPIAGITPFQQMVDYAAAQWPNEKEIIGERHIGQPVRVGSVDYSRVSINSGNSQSTPPHASDVMELRPLATPLASTGFSPRVMSELQGALGSSGLVPVQMGGAADYLKTPVATRPLRPGDPLAVALVMGDFDLSGIGTTTHVDGNRVYGWGHPFLGLGNCELPICSAHIHTVYPRQTVSFKMGSPLRTIGLLRADVSTGIAGTLGDQPDMLPLAMTVQHGSGGERRRFQCRIARQRQLLPQLVFSALSSSIDTEGDLPEELTACLELRIDLEGESPLVVRDTFSGPAFAGNRASLALFIQVSSLLGSLQNHSFEPIRIQAIEAHTLILPYRSTADIEHVRLRSDSVEPGTKIEGSAWLRPWHGPRERVDFSLPLPAEIPDGEYTLFIADGASQTRALLREHPLLGSPQTRENLLRQARLTTQTKRNELVARVNLSDPSLAVNGHELADLPQSVFARLVDSRKGSSAGQPLPTMLVVREPTAYVLQGQQTIKFKVRRVNSDR